MTVLEVIQRSTEFLARKGVESPRLQVELLLAHVLSLPRLNLYLNFERQLTERELEALRELVRRRGQREPVQHLLGTASFCGLEITVNRHVLIPRPETELLAERAWQFLATIGQSGDTAARSQGRRRSEAGSPFLTAMDFGTGSGCLAIALAVKLPQVQVHAVDISGPALAVARQNAARHGVAERIHFHESDGFGALPAAVRFNLIVANPPYIATEEIDSLEPEVCQHDPRVALDGGKEGLDFHRRIACEALRFLAPGGRLMVEFGDGQVESVGAIFQASQWIVEALEADYTGRPRFLVARAAEE